MMRFSWKPSKLKGNDSNDASNQSEDTFPLEEEIEYVPLRDLHQTAPNHEDGQRAAGGSYLQHIFGRWWLWEVLSCTVALSALVAIYGTLNAYNGRQLPDWPSGISLNTLIALISAILKAAMLVPIAEGLSNPKYSKLRNASLSHQRPQSAQVGLVS